MVARERAARWARSLFPGPGGEIRGVLGRVFGRRSLLAASSGFGSGGFACTASSCRPQHQFCTNKKSERTGGRAVKQGGPSGSEWVCPRREKRCAAALRGAAFTKAEAFVLPPAYFWLCSARFFDAGSNKNPRFHSPCGGSTFTSLLSNPCRVKSQRRRKELACQPRESPACRDSEAQRWCRALRGRTDGRTDAALTEPFCYEN